MGLLWDMLIQRSQRQQCLQRDPGIVRATKELGVMQLDTEMNLICDGSVWRHHIWKGIYCLLLGGDMKVCPWRKFSGRSYSDSFVLGFSARWKVVWMIFNRKKKKKKGPFWLLHSKDRTLWRALIERTKRRQLGLQFVIFTDLNLNIKEHN